MRTVHGNGLVQGPELKFQAVDSHTRESGGNLGLSHLQTQGIQNRPCLSKLGQRSGALFDKPLQRGRGLHGFRLYR